MVRTIRFLIVGAMVAFGCAAPSSYDEDSDFPDPDGETDSSSEWVRFPRQMEKLGRGVVAISQGESGVYVGWRLNGDDPEGIAFNLYRTVGGVSIKVNDAPLTLSTNFLDTDGTSDATYHVRPQEGGVEGDPSPEVSVLTTIYKSIPLQGNYVIDRAVVGDLDGDGEYDYVIRQPEGISDPGVWVRSQDTFKLEAYKSDGTFLWQKDLGWNIEQGTWWSPVLVYDLDGDGRAEVIAKTAPTDIDYRNEDGKVLEGPEWLSVFDGETGEELARENWIDRGGPGDWGDDYGNRAGRNKLAVAYLDGKRPSIIVFRGIYRLMKMEAWNFRDGALSQLWQWSYERGGGSLNSRVGDMDGDGFDEIINGSMAVDEDGSDMWITGESHSDVVHLADVDPERPGLEIWYCQEWGYTHPYHLRDASSGALIWGDAFDGGDNGRAVVADVDESSPGLEMWSSASPDLFSANGDDLGPKPESSAWAVWWDGDLLREQVENGVIVKYNAETGITSRIASAVEERYSERFIGDLFGDWREELMYTVPGEMRIYSTALVSEYRFYTLMHDPLYRNDIAEEASGHAQYGNASFFLGAGMQSQPKPEITVK
jgi:rhamnogalacturonan endolyase